MHAVAIPWLIRKGYDGMTFFGRIITHTREDAKQFNSRFDAMKNHEMIHLYQARTTHDSWLCFYWLYFVYWFKALFYRRHLKEAGYPTTYRLKNAAYRLNPFELEAYAHMHELDYLERHPDGCNEWKTYARMSLAERMKLIKKRKQSAT